MRGSIDPGVVARVSLYTQIFNTRLSLALAEFSAPDEIQLVGFDLFSEFAAILDAPASFNYTTIGCVDISSDDILDLLVSVVFPYTQQCQFGSRFDEFVSFDNIHPARVTNKLIGEKMLALLAGSSSSTPSDGTKRSVTVSILLLLLGE
ncbi:MAG: phospholipase/lecithinase/hemolysin [Arenicella sp.]|jgi:phospholipase/lecithinase/hemolysin